MGVGAGAVAVAAFLAAAVLPGLVPAAASAPSWGAAWSAGVTGADAVAAGAVAERITLATGLLVLVAGLGLFTVLLLLVGGRERRRPGLAVRHALGVGRRRLAAHLLSRDRRRLVVLGTVGAVGGAVAGALIRGTWPGLGAVDAASVGSSGAATAGMVGAGAVVVGLVLLVGLLSPLPGLGRRAPTLLRQGHGVTDDPRAGTVRRGAATLQVGLSLSLALTGVALVRGLPGVPGLTDEAAPVGAVGRYAVDDPSTLRDDALLASVGAWTGVGTRDLVTVECGFCTRGTFYLPVYGVDSTVHAVGAEVLEALGARTVEGRTLNAGDRADTELVGVVNPAYRSHFEGGEPVGRRIRLSGSGERWVRVVGVVEDPVFRGPGAVESHDPVLWVPLAQHPASVVEGVAEGGVPEGLTPLGPPLPLGELRRAAVAPVAWAGWILFVSGGLALLLALVSSAEVARVEARGRARAAAIRLSLGASPRGPAARIVGRAAKGAFWGSVLGLAVAWALEDALGVGGAVDPGVRGLLALGVLVAAVAGALPRARALFRLQPAVLLREE